MNATALQMLTTGPCTQSTADLIAATLGGSGAAWRTAQTVHEMPSDAWGSYDGLLSAGVPPLHAERIAAAVELGRRTAAPKPGGDLLHNQKAAGDYLQAALANERQELLGVLLLDERNRLIRDWRPYRGTSNYAAVEPREIFGPALVSKAAKLILYHNHPSGAPSPSAEDDAYTAKMKDLGARLQVPVVDHIVVGSEGWFSYAERRRL